MLYLSNLRQSTERMSQIIGYNTKTVERGEGYLRIYFPPERAPPWQTGLPTLQSARDIKENCRKRTIIYENVYIYILVPRW